MQTLAEQVDGDVQEVFDQAVFLRARTISNSFDVTATGSWVNLPLLNTTFNAQAGKYYRIILCSSSYSTVASDTVQFKVLVGGATIGDFPASANSSVVVNNSSQYHVFTSYWIAPATTPVNITIQVIRALGTGTMHALATSTMASSVTVEDLGIA
jgi:hypothetical protein